MATAFDVASYFVRLDEDNDDRSITNMKLQKLAYYAQGFYLALYDEPLFNERIEAWIHGPVVPELYHTFKDHGYNPIILRTDDPWNKFNDKQREVIEEVYRTFGQYSAWRLRDMTHEEPPWMNHEGMYHENEGNLIPVEEMRDYFKTRLRTT